MIKKILTSLLFQLSFSVLLFCNQSPHNIVYNMQQQEHIPTNVQWNTSSDLASFIQANQRETQITKLTQLHALCSIQPEQLLQLLAYSNNNDLFEYHHLYACPTYLRYISKQPGYEAFIMSLHKRIHSDRPYRKSLQYMPGFKDKKGFTRLIDAEVVRIQVEQKNRVREALCQQHMREMQSKPRLYVSNTRELEVLRVNFIERGQNSHVLKNRYEERSRALAKTMASKASCRDYSSEVLLISGDDIYSEIFSQTYGTDLDCQLHKELIQTKSDIQSLQYSHPHNIHFQIISPAIHRIAAEAKQEQQAEKAFGLSDFCFVLAETLKSAGKGTIKAVQTCLNPKFLQEMITGSLQLGLHFMDAVGCEDARDNMMLAAVFTKDFDTVFAKAQQHCAYTQAQRDAIGKSIKTTFSKIQSTPWENLIEHGAELGVGMVLDVLAMNVLTGFAKASGRAAVEQLSILMERGLLTGEQYAVEVAGFGKLFVEEGASMVPKVSDVAKNDFAFFESLSQEPIAQSIQKSAGRLAQEGGKAFEEFLVKNLGGKGSFKTGGREFDGVVGNLWYEAKSGDYWNKLLSSKDKLNKFKSDIGTHLSIAKKNGASYHLHSEFPIPQAIKDWLTKYRIPFTEWKK